MVRYPFHPLTGQSVLVVGETEHGGVLHLIIRKPDGAKLLLPAWMTSAESGSVKILSCPRLSVNRLLDLRALLDRLMTSSSPKPLPGGGRSNEAMETTPVGSLKTPHGLTPSRRTTAVALLKALLIEAMFADTTKATIEDAAGNNVVEDTRGALVNDQDNA